MVASVPEDTKRTFSREGTSRTTRSASSSSASQGAPYEVPRWAASCTALTTGGKAWPRIMGPQEPT
jgi:hypothetical protein